MTDWAEIIRRICEEGRVGDDENKALIMQALEQFIQGVGIAGEGAPERREGWRRRIVETSNRPDRVDLEDAWRALKAMTDCWVGTQEAPVNGKEWWYRWDDFGRQAGVGRDD